MAAHSSLLAWRIPGTEELGGLLSMGSHNVGHDCSDLAAAAVVTLLGKEMATYSSILAWEMAWPDKPGGLQFMGSQRVRLEKDWQPPPVFLPGEPCGQRSLVGCCP